MDTQILILLVDDEPPIIDMIQRIGRQHFSEAEFVSASSPDVALTYLDDSSLPRPQLILLDIDLHAPTNGFDLLTKIQQHRYAIGIPVIMFTVSASEPDITRAYENGAVAYTRKPESLADWVHYVQMLRDYWFRTAVLPRTGQP
jgi:CheY-like chemotaxis protein